MISSQISVGRTGILLSIEEDMGLSLLTGGCVIIMGGRGYIRMKS